MSLRTVSQFLKWPRMGEVKTRLAKTIGNQEAVSVHVQLCQAVYNNLKKCDAQYVMHVAGIPAGIGGDAFSRWLSSTGVQVIPQISGDLGQRMAAVLSSASPNEYVLVVGSDCPCLTAEYIDRAFEALDRSDLVLGPAEDGGYVLIGAKRFQPDIFDGVRWGEGGVYAQTRRNAQAAGLKVESLPTMWDVDVIEDLTRWRQFELGKEMHGAADNN